MADSVTTPIFTVALRNRLRAAGPGGRTHEGADSRRYKGTFRGQQLTIRRADRLLFGDHPPANVLDDIVLVRRGGWRRQEIDSLAALGRLRAFDQAAFLAELDDCRGWKRIVAGNGSIDIMLRPLSAAFVESALRRVEYNNGSYGPRFAGGDEIDTRMSPAKIAALLSGILATERLVSLPLNEDLAAFCEQGWALSCNARRHPLPEWIAFAKPASHPEDIVYGVRGWKRAEEGFRPDVYEWKREAHAAARLIRNARPW